MNSNIDISQWHGSFNGKESTIQQLAPYIGKLKTGMARALITQFSEPGDIVLDPFCGSGVVPFESTLLGRTAWANDLNPYAYVLTRAKLEAPGSLEQALNSAENLVDQAERAARSIDLRKIPAWVRAFFHKETLREILAAFDILNRRSEFFLRGCLLGILHHQRPGFLSHPASHLVPYLRDHKYPQQLYPEMYAYRDLRSRLLAKIKRAYRRPLLPSTWDGRGYKAWNTDSISIPVESASVDAIITSPPYFSTLSYGRDNRLRLWFLGTDNWREIDNRLSPKPSDYFQFMQVCLSEMFRALKPNKPCVLVLGDISRNGTTRNTAATIANLATGLADGYFTFEKIYDDPVPDDRRSRRLTRTTLTERILILRRSH